MFDVHSKDKGRDIRRIPALAFFDHGFVHFRSTLMPNAILSTKTLVRHRQVRAKSRDQAVPWRYIR